jgi:hypothetical protein
MAYLPTITPGMKTAQLDYVANRIEYQQFMSVCHKELQDIKRQQELKEQEN